MLVALLLQPSRICQGNESSIFDCQLTPVYYLGYAPSSSCTHGNDIGVHCSNDHFQPAFSAQPHCSHIQLGGNATTAAASVADGSRSASESRFSWLSNGWEWLSSAGRTDSELEWRTQDSANSGASGPPNCDLQAYQQLLSQSTDAAYQSALTVYNRWRDSETAVTAALTAFAMCAVSSRVGC